MLIRKPLKIIINKIIRRLMVWGKKIGIVAWTKMKSIYFGILGYDYRKLFDVKRYIRGIKEEKKLKRTDLKPINFDFNGSSDELLKKFFLKIKFDNSRNTL